MTLSRSESQQFERIRRKKRLRRLISVNLILLGLAVIIISIILTTSKNGSFSDWLSNISDRFIQDSENSSAGKDLSADDPDTDVSEGTGQVDGKQPIDEGADQESVLPEDTDDTDIENDGEVDPIVGDEERISLSFVGDVLPDEYMKPLMEKNGDDYLYRKTLLYLSEPDIMAGNLETPITTRGIPVEGMPYVYKASPDVLPVLRDVGFDVMSLANNHLLDQGIEGMHDTMSYLDTAGIGHMGTGNNDVEAFAPYIKEVKGVKVAYVGLSRFIPFVSWKADSNVAGIAESYDSRRAVAAIESAKEQADIVVVMVHWGVDKQDKPENYQKELARQYIDAGADLVVGSHPHVLQGFEQYKGKWIAYSLGNFIFLPSPKEIAAETGVLDAVCSKSGDCELKFNPMLIIEGQPTPLEGEAAMKVLDRLSSISFQAKLEQDGTIQTE